MVSGNSADAKLLALRELMRHHAVDALLIPSADPHLSEYLPEHWQIRRWLTGFSGSVGIVVVTQTQAHLWVDSRYWVQAEQELAGTGFELKRLGAAIGADHLQWLSAHLEPDQLLAVDGRLLSLSQLDTLREILPTGVGLDLSLDLIGQLWVDRPDLPVEPVLEWPAQYAGSSRHERLSLIRQAMADRCVTHHLVSTLDDVAWILNLRGSDVSFNPVFLAHLLIDMDQAALFVDPRKIDAALLALLEADGVSVLPYEQVGDRLADLRSEHTIWLDPARVVSAMVHENRAQQFRSIAPSTLAKACKSPIELQHWRDVMRQDGVALCEFFAWLDHAIDRRAEEALTEAMIDVQVTAARARQAGFRGPSFGTIAAFNANAAMPHYRAGQDGGARIVGDGLLLIDSGGQYLGGTTDITRMVPVGELSAAQRHDCTLVLKAMVAMSRLQFPAGTLAPLLDAVARQVLWQQHVDYGHGTGHGVGYGLNVHEGPQVLSYKATPHPDMALRIGMVTSNEPGLYRQGQWGVRIENLICVQTAGVSEFGQFFKFETLTLCPIDTRCFDLNMLQTHEIAWLNDYHAFVKEQLSDQLSGTTLQWLVDRTEPLPL